jgi:hypothetical protein
MKREEKGSKEKKRKILFWYGCCDLPLVFSYEVFQLQLKFEASKPLCMLCSIKFYISPFFFTNLKLAPI